jgi:nucleoside-diphosphate-sugar epimerase
LKALANQSTFGYIGFVWQCREKLENGRPVQFHLRLRTFGRYFMQQRIFVTGATGFIGSHLVRALKSAGHEVIALDIRPSHTHTTILADVRQWARDKASVQPLDTVIHLAAYWSYQITPNCWLESTRNNTEATRTVFSYAKECGAKRFVFASSLEAVDLDSNDVVDECTKPTESMHHPYAWSKSACEQFLAAQSEGPAASIVRMSGVFSDWCELPPLAWLFDRWSSSWPTGHAVAGHGSHWHALSAH